MSQNPGNQLVQALTRCRSGGPSGSERPERRHQGAVLNFGSRCFPPVLWEAAAGRRRAEALHRPAQGRLSLERLLLRAIVQIPPGTPGDLLGPGLDPAAEGILLLPGGDGGLALEISC